MENKTEMQKINSNNTEKERMDKELANMTVFSFGEAQVRTVVKDGEAWFVAKDVCNVLGISNSRDATTKLDEDERDCVGLTDAIGRNRQTTVISEAGLYKLIFASEKPSAKQFKRWVTHDVLPTIRKQGFYSMLTDEKLLEVAYDRCLHNEDHQTLEFQLFKMQDELTIQRWKAMEEVIWPKRFDYMLYEDADREIEDLWGADVEGAMEAKKFYHNNTCARYGMSRIYGKWKGPKNPLAHRNRVANIDRVMRYEIESVRARSSMGLPLNDTHTLMRDKLALEDRIEEIKEIIARTDKFLTKYEYERYPEPVEDIEEELRKNKLWNTTFAVGHEQLKEYLGMDAEKKR